MCVFDGKMTLLIFSSWLERPPLFQLSACHLRIPSRKRKRVLGRSFLVIGYLVCASPHFGKGWIWDGFGDFGGSLLGFRWGVRIWWGRSVEHAQKLESALGRTIGKRWGSGMGPSLTAHFE